MAQQTIGRVLKNRRTQLDWSLDVAEKRTAIKKMYISALETDNYAALPGAFYVRAYLKQYATKLELDVAGILEAYDNKHLVEVDDQLLEDTGNYRFIRPDQRQPDKKSDPAAPEEGWFIEADSEDEEIDDGKRHYLPIIILSSIAVLIVAGVTAIILLNRPQNEALSADDYSLSTSSSSSSSSKEESSSSSSSPTTSISLSQTGSTLVVSVVSSQNPVILNFALDAGAATTTANLTNTNVQSLTLSSDNPSAEATVNASSGTATIQLNIPDTLTIKINNEVVQLTDAMKQSVTSLQLNLTYPQIESSSSSS